MDQMQLKRPCFTSAIRICCLLRHAYFVPRNRRLPSSCARRRGLPVLLAVDSAPNAKHMTPSGRHDRGQGGFCDDWYVSNVLAIGPHNPLRDVGPYQSKACDAAKVYGDAYGSRSQMPGQGEEIVQGVRGEAPASSPRMKSPPGGAMGPRWARHTWFPH